ncbi:MAG: hypothetical protein J6J43_01120 [Oscillospiraceae bacterium]|nr:hypothetical protein [Oscillospiraceae bacterium]
MARIRKTTAGREKKYSAAMLERECDAYFASISYLEPIKRKVPATDPSGVLLKDDKGHQLYKMEPVYTSDGKEAKQTMWTEPPSIMGLCMFLGIHRTTFYRYGEMDGDDEESQRFRNTVTRAQGRVEAYAISKLEDKSAARGAIFNLQNNFGWSEKKEVEMGEKTREAVAYGAGMTMQEKIQWLKEQGMDVSAFE